MALESQGGKFVPRGKCVLVCYVAHAFISSCHPLLSRLTACRAGDAAHSFPPTGGLGLNSGLADVHNLAYKLALVLKGKGSDSLLDTYESDRRHVAVVNSMQSVKNGKKIFKLLKTLGIGDDVMAARKNLYTNIQDPEKMKVIDQGIEEQREHFDNVSLFDPLRWRIFVDAGAAGTSYWICLRQ